MSKSPSREATGSRKRQKQEAKMPFTITLNDSERTTLTKILIFVASEGYPHFTKEMMKDYEAIAKQIGMGDDDHD